jgi:SPP1 gp7 family putative phage head morphogenesis protein
MHQRLNRNSISWCLQTLGKEETMEIVRLAMKTERFRATWIRKWGDLLELLNSVTAQSLITNGKVPGNELIPHIEEFLNKHLDATIQKGIDHADDPVRQRLAVRGFRDLQKLWDKVRAGKTPKRLQVLAHKIKTDYIRKCQSVWNKYSRDFRIGEATDIYNQQKAVKVLTEASDGVYARGKMIVETETTRYYNQARKSYFDQSEDVSHYLFLAIMDVATTKWCKTRHRLVYKKDEKVTEIETPPVHWNCRSEMVPLSPLNPRHKKLIDDKSQWRENRRPERLPEGWNK